jgi:hypothetical protein
MIWYYSLWWRTSSAAPRSPLSASHFRTSSHFPARTTRTFCCLLHWGTDHNILRPSSKCRAEVSEACPLRWTTWTTMLVHPPPKARGECARRINNTNNVAITCLPTYVAPTADDDVKRGLLACDNDLTSSWDLLILWGRGLGWFAVGISATLLRLWWGGGFIHRLSRRRGF